MADSQRALPFDLAGVAKEVEAASVFRKRSASLQQRRVDGEASASAAVVVAIATVLLSLVTLVAGKVKASLEKRAQLSSWFQRTDKERALSQSRAGRGRRYSLFEVVVWSDYPSLGVLLNSLALLPRLGEEGARLLQMLVQEFPLANDLHWCGDGAQLRASRLPSFLSSHAAWRSDENPFRFLFRDQASFLASEEVGLAKMGESTLLSALFSGGFCGLASATGPSSDALDVARALLGRKVRYRRVCHAERRAAGFEAGSQAAAFSMTGVLVLAPIVGVVGLPLLFGAAVGTGAGLGIAVSKKVERDHVCEGGDEYVLEE